MPDPAVVAETMHSAYDWLELIGLGGVVGALGQGARTIVGLKKVNDAASAEMPAHDLIVASRLVTSFAIGAVAGAAAAIGFIDKLSAISLQQIFSIAAAGYAGADFIEGFVNRTVGSPDTPAGQETVGTGTRSDAEPSPADSDAVG